MMPDQYSPHHDTRLDMLKKISLQMFKARLPTCPSETLCRRKLQRRQEVFGLPAGQAGMLPSEYQIHEK